MSVYLCFWPKDLSLANSFSLFYRFDLFRELFYVLGVLGFNDVNWFD